jgi:hypothetical protein
MGCQAMAVRWTLPHPPPTVAPATTPLLPCPMLCLSALAGVQCVAPAMLGKYLKLQVPSLLAQTCVVHRILWYCWLLSIAY